MIAIDPGYECSAVLEYHDGCVGHIRPNEECLSWCRRMLPDVVVIEMVASYGMPVGREIFETVRWIGRFQEAIEHRGGTVAFVYRSDVKLHLCGTMRAKDSNVRQALIDRFGPGKAKAIGTKKAPGPLYGITSHLWAALAVAVYWNDTQKSKRAIGLYAATS